MPKLAVFDAKPYDRQFMTEANLGFGFELKFFPTHLNADTVGLAAGYDAVCVFVNDNLTREVIDALYDLGIRVIALRSAGYNHVDLKAAYLRINVVHVPTYSPNAVAEHAAALMLTLNRKTHRAYFRTRDNNFSIVGFLGSDLQGKVAGVIGTGRIGQVFIRIMRGFGMRVVAFDKFADDRLAEELGFEYVPMGRLFEESDVISLHCPLTPETRHLIDDNAVARMKKGVTIINTGRGELIDTRALIEGLKSAKIGAAGLDVYEEESEFFFEDFSDSFIPDDILARLLTFNNVLITSHQGFFTEEAMTNIARVTMENLRDFFDGRPLPNEVCYRCDTPDCKKETTGRCF